MKSKIPESTIHSVLDNLLFNKNEFLPLILCRHPRSVTLLVMFVYQIIDFHKKKDTLIVSN